MLGHRFPGQPADRPRHGAQIRLRVLPRLADLPRACGASCARPWSRSRAVATPLADRAGDLGDDVPPIRRTRPRDEQRQLALRIAIFGGVALALFGILFFRLWFLQILNGERVPGRGQQQPHPRIPGQRPARQHPRPRGRHPRRQPDQPRAPGQPAEAARRRSPQARRAEAARANSPTRTLPKLRKTMHEELKTGARRAGDRCAATSATTSSTTWKRTRAASPGSTSSASSCAATRRKPSPPTSSAASARSTKEDLEEPRYKGLEAGRLRSARKGSRTPTTSYLRGKPGVTRIQVDAFGQPTAGRQARLAAAGPGRQPGADDRRRRAERRRRRRSRPRACAAPS